MQRRRDRRFLILVIDVDQARGGDQRRVDLGCA